VPQDEVTLDADTFWPLRNLSLTSLQLTFFSLCSLPDGTFRFAEALKVLSIYLMEGHGKIYTNFFYGLDSLEQLMLGKFTFIHYSGVACLATKFENIDLIY
jgi:hypothetical protein